MFFRFVQKFFVFMALTAGFPCGVYATTRNPGSATEGTYAVGQQAQGGVIFWVTPDRKHGLVAALTDATLANGDPTILWRTVALADPPIGAKAAGVWVTAGSGDSVTSSGKINTDLICTACASSTGYAAKACKDYRGGGYTDWYLPSLEELMLMMAMQNVIVTSGGAPFEKKVNPFYWSSLEDISAGAPDGSYAWGLYSSNGFEYGPSQYAEGRVRACRAF